MNGQVVATIENDGGAIGAIQLGHGVAAFDPSGVARHRNDVVDDDVLGQQVEEVLAVHQSGYTSFDDPKEWVQGLEVVEVADLCHRDSSTAQLVAVRRAKSAKLVGATPVAFPTSSLGREPWPMPMVSVSIRRTAPYSAGIPLATAPAT